MATTKRYVHYLLLTCRYTIHYKKSTMKDGRKNSLLDHKKQKVVSNKGTLVRLKNFFKTITDNQGHLNM